VAGPHENFMSGRSEKTRPGYAEIKAASALHPDSGAWAFFMREIVRLPYEMTPAVSQVIRIERWKFAPDPLESVRSDALEAHRRAWTRPLFRSPRTA
jgi:hypothetical protein